MTLVDEMARMLEVRGLDGARLGAEAAADCAVALAGVWEGRLPILLCRGPADGAAREIASAAAHAWHVPRPPVWVDMEKDWSELTFLRSIGRDFIAVEDDLWIDGLGIEPFPPGSVCRFLEAWLPRAAPRGRVRHRLFAWTPLGREALAARYGRPLAERLFANAIEIELPGGPT